MQLYREIFNSPALELFYFLLLVLPGPREKGTADFEGTKGAMLQVTKKIICTPSIEAYHCKPSTLITPYGVLHTRNRRAPPSYVNAATLIAPFSPMLT